MLQQRNTAIIKAWRVKLNCLILLVENHPDQIGGNRLLPFTQSIFSTTWESLLAPVQRGSMPFPMASFSSYYFQPHFPAFRQPINPTGARLVCEMRRRVVWKYISAVWKYIFVLENTPLRSGFARKPHFPIFRFPFCPQYPVAPPGKGLHTQWLVSTPVSRLLSFSSHPMYLF